MQSRWRTTLLVLTAAALLAVSCGIGASSSKSSAPVDTAPCSGPTGVGAEVPAGLGPGDLVAAEDLTAANQSSSGFPTSARVWRTLYVSTGVDESDLQLVCAMVAAPANGPTANAGRGRLLAWGHGTIGLDQSCLPSNQPATAFWGPMANGIGAIKWGALLGKYEGDAAGGALQYAMDQGWVVAATDYQPTDTYIVGKIAGANMLDSARAAAQLMAQVFDGTPTDYDMMTWGHSQGGHAALFAGQLAEPYLAGTTPSKPTPSIRLVGVATEAPASNFIIEPEGQPDLQPGDGLADWAMHESIKIVGLPIADLELQMGPALFSYIFGSWNQLSQGRPPAPDAQFPAYPLDAAALDLAAVATPEGAATIATVQPLCLAGSDANTIKEAVAPYRNAEKHQMLVAPIWNLPTSGYSAGHYFKGGFDETCINSTDGGVQAWCEWTRWNLPGPLGTNPFPDAPLWDGQLVPLLIAQGSDDQVIHCQPAPKTSSSVVPDGANCMSTALYDSLSQEVYCPDTGAAGTLTFTVVRKDGALGSASHQSIPGQIAAKKMSKHKDDLVFDGSPLQQFMAGAFDGTSQPGCTAQVLNP